MIERICGHCGNGFQIHASRMKHGRGLHCSRDCQYAARRARPKLLAKFQCIGCDVEFERNPNWVKRKGGGKFCTRSCRDKHWKGAITPNWQDGSGVYKRGPHWYATRRRILKRDGACVCCGTAEKLHVHHVIPFRMFDDSDRANADSNLVALCPPCHRRADARFKWVKLPDSGSIIQMNAGGAAWELARERGMI